MACSDPASASSRSDTTASGAANRTTASSGPTGSRALAWTKLTEGYGVSALVSSWRNRVSSLKGFNYCNVVEIYNGINYAEFLASRGAGGSGLGLGRLLRQR